MKPTLKFLIPLIMVLLFPAFMSGAEKVVFSSDNYYRIANEGTQGLVLTETGPTTVILSKSEESKPKQLWTLSELSGSWRIINSASNLAVRYDNEAVVLGANNGSDEAQLWKISDGLLLPANKAGYAMAASENGSLILIPVASAKGNPKAQFSFEGIAVKGGKSDGDESRRANYWENETMFGENKEPGIATYMPYRSEAAMKADAAYYRTPGPNRSTTAIRPSTVHGSSISSPNPPAVPSTSIKRAMT